MKAAARREVVVAATLAALAVIGVAAVRAPAEAMRAAAKESDESFLLPPPQQLVRSSLGYRAAVADYLWAHILVTQGLRLGERRRFSTVTEFLDAITTLDPDFREPYLLTDALTTMQAKSATQDDIRTARALLERGANRFPNDAAIWQGLGEFVVYVAPISYLTDPQEQDQWRRDGAAFLGRAAELGSEDAKIAWRALGGARAFQRSGERQATIRFYTRALAVTQDPELRAELERRLAPLLGEETAEAWRARRTRFEAIWKEHYRDSSLTGVLIGGPPVAFASCAGGTAAPESESPSCATTWAQWTERVDREAREQSRIEASVPNDAPPAPSASAPSAPSAAAAPSAGAAPSAAAAPSAP